jgi:rubrerythrin
MKIKKIVSQHRRDFTAVYECEHCGDTVQGGGYDDAYFHNRVIPEAVCVVCGKTADKNYRPLAPKYAEHEVI